MGYKDLPLSDPFNALVDGKGRIVIPACDRKKLGLEPNDVVRVIGLKRLGKNGKVPPENIVFDTDELI